MMLTIKARWGRLNRSGRGACRYRRRELQLGERMSRRRRRLLGSRVWARIGKLATTSRFGRFFRRTVRAAISLPSEAAIMS